MGAPDFSADLYREITEFAEGTPSWVHSAAEVGTDGGLLLFAALFVAGWWRARGRDAREMGLALAAPFAVVAAYLVSEVSKSFIQEERPCRAVAGAVHIAACPAPGDWSFPSNHATIAAASAAAIVVAWRVMAPVVLPLAALMAFSRVFVGVHYPHDVAAGFLVGVVVAPVAALVLVRALRPLVEALRGVAAGAVLLGSPVAAGPAGGAGVPQPAGVAPGGAAPVMGAAGMAQPAPSGGAWAGDASVTMPDVMGGVPPRPGSGPGRVP
ncbi:MULTISPECIES: phosphatase PAP2 family protein [Actinomadura]|uniref:Undecaprenyl-diphosphatase n=1 Tax=Actinomadura madurae TaxID=1993 RepID=A0A1I5JUH9_9ACTN|nr:phosphatase PAP2 family protein [Actinomadura madurae]SFO76061.1 undecaprenyl-diphosphatase [Actinomadura madurae]SPT64270.1 undecaprenyl pyrophosphate phosphatase [Actinomadura madurae]